MPFVIANEEEVARVKEAIAKRDITLLKSAKEKFICYGHCMGRHPDIAKQLMELKKTTDETQESDSQDAYQEAIDIFGVNDNANNKPGEPAQQTLGTKTT